jgi:uncharacterized protein YbaP (TraB family)
MNYKYSWIVLSLLLAFTSCKTSKKAALQKQDDKLVNALLWEMKVDGVEKPSYVYGTIHMIGKEDYFLPKGTLAAMEESEKMVFEIDIADMTDMGSLMGIMNKIFMNDGGTLKDLLNDADYKVVTDHFSDLGLPMMMLERIKPMFLSAFAYADMDPTSMQSGDIKSYEMEFYEMAQSKKMTTGGLETIDFQISVFDSIPYKDQAQLLVETIKAGDTDNDEFKIMVDMYKAQDIHSMVSMISDEESGFSDYEDILLAKRNKAWIPQMVEQAKLQPTFFAVGAGHLSGKMGVLNLLKKESVTIRPLSN